MNIKAKFKSKRKLDKRYWVTRKEYNDAMCGASHSFDKIIIGISTAAIGFAFALTNYKQSIYFVGYSILAIILFMFAIIFSLISLWLWQEYGQKGISDLNKEYKKSLSKSSLNSITKYMECTQNISGICFAFALILLTIFISCNLIIKANTSNVKIYIEDIKK